MYVGYFDPNPHRPPAQKIAAACDAYRAHFPGEEPTQVLVNEHEACEIDGLEIVVKPYIRPHNFHAGRPDEVTA